MKFRFAGDSYADYIAIHAGLLLQWRNLLMVGMPAYVTI